MFYCVFRDGKDWALAIASSLKSTPRVVGLYRLRRRAVARGRWRCGACIRSQMLHAAEAEGADRVKRAAEQAARSAIAALLAAE